MSACPAETASNTSNAPTSAPAGRLSMVSCPSVARVMKSAAICAASSKMAKPSGTEVTMVRVRLPWAMAGAARAVAAEATPPAAEARRKERRSIVILPCHARPFRRANRYLAAHPSVAKRRCN